jgi:citrate lyase subunit beta / citryl-CoA lyase
MPGMRRICAEAAGRVRGRTVSVVTVGEVCSCNASRASLSRYNATAALHFPSDSSTLRTPRRCASLAAGGGRDDVSFLTKLKDLYHEFQLSQDRKLDKLAAEEAEEGRDDGRDLLSSSSSTARKSARLPLPRNSPLIACNPNLCPRSVLFVPGSKPHAMWKIPSLSADAFILDLEDSVGVNSKRQARENIRDFVEGLRKTRRLHRDEQVSDTVNAIVQGYPTTTEVPSAGEGEGGAAPADTDRCDLYPRLVVRINSPDFDLATAMLDLELVGLLGPAIEGIAIPKTTPYTYSLIKDYIHPDHQLWAFFESPKSVIQAPAICKQQVYQYAVMGYNDLSMELQLPMSSAPSSLADTSDAVKEALHITAHLPLWQCTSQVLQAARAYNMFVLDAVFNDPTDKAGFRRSLQECKALGLNGKTLIHPSQIEPTNAIYTPSEVEVTWAMRIIEAVRKAQGGVATVDGKMVEELHKRQADRVLVLHRSAVTEKELRAREAAAVTVTTTTGEAGEPASGAAAEKAAREPRRTPSRHRPVG